MKEVAAQRHVSLKYLAVGAVCALFASFAPSPATGSPGAFPHGVASRAKARSVILWTRTDVPGEFRFRLSKQSDLTPAVASGTVRAKLTNDNTIKKQVKRLEPGTRYYFRFVSDDSASTQGTFRTLPSPGKKRDIELALSGDSDELWDGETYDPDYTPVNDQERPFEVLDRIREERPDLFVYMGDTIYSDSETEAPPALTLPEKWEKYKNNRLPATKGLLEKVSTWAVWDDHEVINDFDGKELKEDDPALFHAGRDAFRDYWPIPDTGRMYRKVNFGSEVDLIFLDERSYREESADVAPTPCRDDGGTGDLDLAPTMPQEQRAELGLGPVDPDCLDHVKDPGRTMLGEKQLDWLKKKLRTSNARWKLIINEVPMSQLFVRPYDRWEGYHAERRKILSYIDNKNVRGAVFLTTDLHANIGGTLYRDITNEGAKPVGYEMITGPVQTCTLDCEVDKILGDPLAGEFLQDFLIDEGLTDTDCINIDHYGYGLVSTVERTDKLKLEYKSHSPLENGAGGETIFGCPDKTMGPRISGG